jgi:hypothetical protein
MIRATVGEPVRAGDTILELRYRDAARLQAALPLADAAVHVSREPPAWQDLIIEEVV